MTEEQFDKLPRWARDEIQKLLADLKSAESRAAIVEGKSDAKALMENHPNHIPLPINDIRFVIGGGNVTCSVRSKNGESDHLAIYTSSATLSDVAIIPRSSNHFEVVFVERKQKTDLSRRILELEDALKQLTSDPYLRQFSPKTIVAAEAVPEKEI